MAVIINDFEIAVEAPPVSAPQQDGSGEPDQPPRAALRPLDIEAVVARVDARRSRVDAT